jgi:hypothetical protein
VRPKVRQGPEGRRLNVSPTRKGWGTREDDTTVVGAALYRTATWHHGVHPDVTRPAGSLTVHSHCGKRGSEAGVELGVW